MGYFSNGSEGMEYQARYCDRCVNMKQRVEEHDGESCPVWDVHTLYNYDGLREKNLGSVLEMLIPRTADGLDNEECEMFLAQEEAPGA